MNPQGGQDCAADVYQQAGITNPREDFDVVEIYVPFSWYEPMWMENLGFAPSGDGWKMTESGATSMEGDMPVNCSGGVLSSNPIGASGMLRFAEAAQQVRGLAGEHQIDGARRALGHAYGGAAQYFSMWVVGARSPDLDARKYMDVDLPAEDDPRRLEVRRWFEEHPTPTPRELVDAGYVVPHWPRPYGLDAEPELQLIIEDEMRRAGCRKPINPIGIGHCGPILVALASDEQKDRYLWPMLAGEEMWCQLFSEPGAGSDLANLSTRAERDGDVYVVNGQKIWTSLAEHAKFGILIARTRSRRVEAPRHLVLHHPDGPRGHRGAPDPQHDRRRAASTRCSSPTCGCRPRT